MLVALALVTVKPTGALWLGPGVALAEEGEQVTWGLSDVQATSTGWLKALTDRTMTDSI